MMRFRFALLAAGAVLTAAPVQATSAPAAPAADGGGGLHMVLGYDGKLLVKVLDIQVEQRATAYGFSASARLISYGILAAFKHVDERATVSGRIVRGTPRPGTFTYQNLGGKTHRTVSTVWGAGAVSMRANPPFRNLGNPAASTPQKLAAADPLTQLMRLTLNVSRATACRETYHFFDGKQAYDLAFSNPTPLPLSDKERRFGLINGMRCNVRYIEVAGFNPKKGTNQNQGLRKPILVDFAEVGQGGPLVMTSLHAQTPLGYANIDLNRLTVTGRNPVG